MPASHNATIQQGYNRLIKVTLKICDETATKVDSVRRSPANAAESSLETGDW